MSEKAVPATAGAGFAARDLFQVLSYLQYPAMLVALGYMARSIVALLSGNTGGWPAIFDDWNYALLYAGVGIGLSSLQDPTRIQNKASKKVWQDPRKGRLLLCLLAMEALVPIVIGLAGAYLVETTMLSQLSLGLVAFGLGMLGLLKTAIEMREHHRLDKHRMQEPGQ